MSKQDDGGPAFPTTDDFGFITTGISVRDYFAAKAMQAMVENYALKLAREEDGSVESVACDEEVCRAADEVSEAAYVVADSMMEARK